LRILIATDIAARGIDVDGISHVVNYDLPNIPESYVHRIGRTARAGRDGVAISFCDHEENGFLRDIERTIRIKIPSEDKRTGRSAGRSEPAPHHHANGRNGGGNRRGGNGQNRGRNGGQGQGHGHGGQGHGEQRPQRAKGHGHGGHNGGHQNGNRPAAAAGGHHGGGEDIGGMKFMQRGPNRPRNHAPR
jgi:superfamily II DNA/RNA helicase